MSSAVFKLSFAASVLSLAAAYTAQYGFGLMPCELCIAQRVPYAIVIVLSALALAVKLCRKWGAYIIILAFLIGGGIASYHAAVEKHIVAGPATCTASGSDEGLSVDEMLKKIQEAPSVACDKPQWEFHGITMAAINAVWSFVLAGVTFMLLKKGKANAAG